MSDLVRTSPTLEPIDAAGDPVDDDDPELEERERVYLLRHLESSHGRRVDRSYTSAEELFHLHVVLEERAGE